MSTCSPTEGWRGEGFRLLCLGVGLGSILTAHETSPGCPGLSPGGQGDMGNSGHLCGVWKNLPRPPGTEVSPEPSFPDLAQEPGKCGT